MVTGAAPPAIPCNRRGFVDQWSDIELFFLFILLSHKPVKAFHKSVDEIGSALIFTTCTHLGVLLVDVAVRHIYSENLCKLLDDFFGGDVIAKALRYLEGIADFDKGCFVGCPV